MPLYEFECEGCKRRWEILERKHLMTMHNCVHCGGKVVRLVSAPALRFKGDGWTTPTHTEESK